MENSGTSTSQYGGVCGAYSRDRKQEIRVVPLLTCSKISPSTCQCFYLLVQRTKLTLYHVDLEYLQSQKRLMPRPFVHCKVAKLGLGWPTGAGT